MFSPKDLKEFLKECQANIATIKYQQCVIDDSQMTNQIGKIKIADNLLLFGVLPDYAADTRSEDALMFRSGFDLLVLKKAKRSHLDLEDLMDDMQECFETIELLAAKILEQMRSGCGKFSFLDENSLQITPVWAKAGTNGYMISLSLREG